MGKVIGIMSLKGGVGKTSLVSSLGTALASFGKDVLLVDANFSAPNLGIHFNLIEPETTLHDVMARDQNISDAIYAVGALDVIPAAIFSNKKLSPLRLKEHIRPLKKKYDFILLDSPPSLEEDGLATLYAADELFFVSTPDHSTLSNTIKSVNRSNERGTVINGIILNKVHDKDFELTLEQIEDTTNVPIMAVIPHDIDVKEAQANFKSFVEHNPKSKGTREVMKLAATLTGEEYKNEPTGFNLIKKFLQIKPKKQEVNREVLYERIFGE
ncbi:AAA family ATPase [Candidatus Pacearchaeota archaeon]|nr:AAA family ATPase [Candidatus Pacearchaeota archaeon]